MLYFKVVIDWFSVFINSFWIVGLAVILASFSYHYWLAGEEKRPLKIQLNQPAFQKPFWSGILLVSIGLAGTSQKLWEIGIWTIFALFCCHNIFTLIKHR